MLSAADRSYILSLQPLGALVDIEFDFLSRGQFLVSIHLDGGEVSKNVLILIVIRIYKSVTLHIAKPLDRPGGHDSSSFALLSINRETGILCGSGTMPAARQTSAFSHISRHSAQNNNSQALNFFKPDITL
jgi:hypothetical protein